MLDLRPSAGPRLALQISPRDEGLEVRVVESPVGEAAASEVRLQAIDDVLRAVSQPTFHEEVGRGLFRSLFPGMLGELYRAAVTQAAAAGETLTVELRFDRDRVQLAQYPWELLHDSTRFLLQSGAINLVRYVTFPEPPRPLKPRSPLELLVIAARPKDQPPLASEFDALEKAFTPLIREDKLDLAHLLPPTWDALTDWVLAGAPGVLHFEGHGAFTQTGLLIFETVDGESDPVDAVTLGNLFYSTDLRLAVLSACDTSKAAGETLLGSVAPSLILAGIPAVVAMQQRLPDEAAIRFSRGFYNALLAGQDLESAVKAGRTQLVRSTFWHVPTLYLRAAKPPAITQAFLERRIDTAGPRSAPVNLPLRFGLWIRRPDSPKPTDDDLRRLLGLEPEEVVSRDESPARMRFPVEGAQIQPGLVEVRLIAPGCEIHTEAIKQMTVFPDFDTPPVWFPLTPSRVGRLEITFEISQGGALIATAGHTVHITEGREGLPVAAVHSHTVEAAPIAPVGKPEKSKDADESLPDWLKDIAHTDAAYPEDSTHSDSVWFGSADDDWLDVEDEARLEETAAKEEEESTGWLDDLIPEPQPAPSPVDEDVTPKEEKRESPPPPAAPPPPASGGAPYQPPMEILLQHATTLYTQGNQAAAFTLLQQIELMARAASNNLILGQALHHQARVLYQMGQTDQSMVRLQQAELIVTEAQHWQTLASVLSDQAVIFTQAGQPENALNALERAHQILTALHDINGLAVVLGQMGFVLYNLSRFEEALARFRDQQAVLDQLDNPDNLPPNLFWQAVVYTQLGRRAEGLALAREAHQLAARANNAGLARQIMDFLNRLTS